VLVLGHQGGWDEALLVAGPVILLAALLVRANRKAARLQREAHDDGPDEPSGP
jgi:hypothetical protein